jgi:hypothetical protein
VFTELLPTTERGIHLTEPLLSKSKYAAEMGLIAIICIPSFIKIGSDVQKLIGGIQRHTGSMMREVA